MKTGPGTLERIRGALASPDFRKLFAIRLVSQFSDGLFQAALVASVVFLSPEQQDTAVGFLKATLIIALPYSILGPFTGVFIDRWRRRRILVVAPWVKAACGRLVLFDPIDQAIPFFAGALLVLSVNRFFLSTAAAVVPRLVPHEDLLVANSLATVGGTVALLDRRLRRGTVVDAVGATAPVVIAAGIGWLAASWIASRIASALKPHTRPEDPELLRHQLRRVGVEFADGRRTLLRSPRAIGPITSITLDQIGQGMVLTISLVVFRHTFGEGVASFSNLIGAGGVGVLLGILTVGQARGALREAEDRRRRVRGRGDRARSPAFITGLERPARELRGGTHVRVEEDLRGHDGAAGDPRRLSRAGVQRLRRRLQPRSRGRGGARDPDDPSARRRRASLAAVGIVFLLWAPVVGRWYGREPELTIRFYAGGRADEEPRSIVWGGVEEPVELVPNLA